MTALAPVRMRPGAVPAVARPAVFLDRDGVLVDEALAVPDEVAPSLRQLADAGFVLVEVTNQPDVARGLTTLEEVVAVEDRLLRTLPLDDAYLCVHDTVDGCTCRKPRPGMLLHAADDWNLDLSRSWLIGDRWVDIAAAAAAGVAGVLLERPASWEPTSDGPPPPDLAPVHTAATVGACVVWLLESDP